MFDYEIDFWGYIAKVVAESDAKAKYQAFKGFRDGFSGDGLYPQLEFKSYIQNARIVGKVRRIA